MRDLGLMWAASLLLKGTALLVLVFLVAAVLRRASAGVRHLVWSGGIVALLALPLVSLALPWRLPLIATAGVRIPGVGRDVSPAVRVAAGAGAPAAFGAGRQADSPSLRQAAGAPAGEASRQAPSWHLSPVLLAELLAGLWVAGALVLLGRLGFGMALIRRIVRRATPLDGPDWRRPLLEGADRLGLARLPRLVMSDRLPMPFACGVARPTIVLPASAAAWTDRRRRAVLCHELAHLRRLDLAVNALGQLACAVYWLHPLVWLAVRKLRMESERACDDLVLGVGTRPSEYADHLLQIVCSAARRRTPAVALPMAERREFEGRMLAILERDARREPPARRHALALAGLAAALLLPLAALGPALRAPVSGEGGIAQQPADRATPPTPAAQQQSAMSVTTSMHTAVRRDTHVATTTPVRQQGPARGGAARGKGVQHAVATAVQEVARDAVRDLQAQRGATADPKVIAALLSALDDSVATVREDAAYALGQLEAKQAATPLGARLGREPDAKVRTMIAWALGQIESRDATAPLARMVQGDPSPEARAMAIWALGQLEDPAAIPALAAALRDSSAEVRGRATWAIGSIEPKTAPPELLTALTDAAPTVRMRAAWALGQIADPVAVPGLTAAMKDSSADVRKAAFWALGQMDGDVAQPALLAALKSPDPDVRAAAARALGGGHMDPWPWPWPMPIVR
jgi:HEAT repeat protein/beta-lactamase regulating signal transducer with metallopeptidase domain